MWALSCGTQTLSCGMRAGSSSPTRDWTWAPCIGNTESYPLDHREGPFLEIFKTRTKRNKPFLSVGRNENRECQADIFSSTFKEKPTILREVEKKDSDHIGSIWVSGFRYFWPCHGLMTWAINSPFHLCKFKLLLNTCNQESDDKINSREHLDFATLLWRIFF